MLPVQWLHIFFGIFLMPLIQSIQVFYHVKDRILCKHPSKGLVACLGHRSLELEGRVSSLWHLRFQYVLVPSCCKLSDSSESWAVYFDKKLHMPRKDCSFLTFVGCSMSSMAFILSFGGQWTLLVYVSPQKYILDFQYWIL